MALIEDASSTLVDYYVYLVNGLKESTGAKGQGGVEYTVYLGESSFTTDTEDGYPKSHSF
jgi:hypothetical protein